MGGKMKLRQRLILILVSTTVVLIFLLLKFSSSGLMESFQALEQSEVKKNVARVDDAFGQRVNELHGKSSDWAYWDDAYKFMEDHNQSFITSNLQNVNMKVDAIVFVDNNGKIFQAKSLQRRHGLPLPKPDDLIKQVHFEKYRQGKSFPQSLSSGLIMHQGHLMAISVRSILRSDQSGNQHGWIVFASYIDSEDLANIAQRAHVKVSLFSLENPRTMTPQAFDASLQLKTVNDVVALPADDDRISGYTFLEDIHRKPIQLLQTGENREIYAQGQEETNFLVHIIAFTGTAFSLVVLLAIERIIIARLARLTKNVEIIRSAADLTKRVTVSGMDEISDLKIKFNGMLDSLELNTENLRRSEDKLRLYSENLESTVLERTKEIEHLAYHDQLTGLPNRALLLDRINQALLKDQSSQFTTAVLFIDLDNFKLVNDSLVHSFGDLLLTQVAQILTMAVRPGDTVARIGGDEFTVLLENLDSVETGEVVAGRILSALRKPIELSNRETYAGASIGIAYYSCSQTTSDDLLRHADTAMYRAKAAGKLSFVTYDESMDDHAIERLELETSLRKALENDEIFVEYQPLIDLTTNVMIGAEALARWNHPERGLVSPGMFIPIAEDTGLILPIGYWILEQSCLQAKAWSNEYGAEDFMMSVNLSGKQLQRDDVVERIREILEYTCLPPKQLKLEITESILMEDREDIIEKMVQIKKLGCQLALDDFGTGYSSLSTLRSFPIDTLKIDRAFISRLGEEESALPIVEAILGLAKTMHMTVTGEGVENKVQQDIIRSLGCQVGQGYYYDRPLRAEEFFSRILKGNTGVINHLRNKAA